MHTLKFTWKKVIKINSPLFKTIGQGKYWIVQKSKNTHSSVEHILMSQSHSAVCADLPSSPGLFNSYSQCRWNWPCLVLLGQVNNHIEPWCQHTLPYFPPQLTISLSHWLQQHKHSKLGLIDTAATNLLLLSIRAKAWGCEPGWSVATTISVTFLWCLSVFGKLMDTEL